MSEELYRLQGKTKLGDLTLVLTPTHLILDPGSEFHTKLSHSFGEAQEKVGEVGGGIGWVTRAALKFAGDHVAKAFEPHPLREIDLHLTHDHIEVDLSKHRVFDIGEIQVDPAEAYIFEVKFRQARKALGE